MSDKYVYDCEYILDILEEKEDDICEELIDGLSEEMKNLFAKYVAVRNTIERIKESLGKGYSSNYIQSHYL